MFTTRVSRVLQSFNFRLCHAFAKLSPQAQRAVWSCRIIKEISEAEQEADYFEVVDEKKKLKPSLADKIKNLKISQMGCKEDQLDNDIRQEVINMFIKGVYLNYKLYHQQRLVDGAKTTRLQSKGPFVFYPNSLVTKFMFNNISFEQMPNRKRFLLYGNYGISKTAAIVLYHLLSSLVNQFFYKAPSNQRLNNELNSLLQRNLIQNIPKIFYYSSSKIDETEFINLIKQQCTEVATVKQDWEQLQNINYESQLIKIRRLYANRGIRIVVAFDQLNAVASILRKYNTELKEKKLQQDFQMLKKLLAKRQIHRIQQLQQLCNHIFFNSSVDIEMELLRKQPDYSPDCQYTLDFNRHSDILRGKLPYDKFMFRPWGQVSFSHCVWSQIQRKLVSLSVPSQSQKRMKMIYFQRLQDTKLRWPNYMRFLNVRKAIFPDQEMLERQQPFYKVNQSNYTDKLNKGIERILDHGFQTFLRTLTLILQKGGICDKQRRLRMILDLYELVSQIAEESPQNTQLFKICLTDFKNNTKVQFDQFLKEQRYGYELFPFFIEEIQEVQNVIFFYTPADLKKVYSQLIFGFLRTNITVFHLFEQCLKGYRRFLGIWVQFTLLKILTVIEAQISLIIKTPEISQMDITIKVASVQRFLHFNIKRSKVWNSLYYLFQRALKSEGRDVIGLPTTKDQNVDDYQADERLMISQNSKCFDAAIVKFAKNRFQITTLDLTIQADIRLRLDTAFKCLQQITTQNTIEIPQDKYAEQKYPTFKLVQENKNFYVQHIIFLPKQDLKKVIGSTQIKGQKWQICFAALEDINIENDQRNLDAKIFKNALLTLGKVKKSTKHKIIN